MNKKLKKLGIYQIKEIIGRGGMGVVYRGYHPQLQKSVAIKIISPKSSITLEDRKRFFNEARLTSRLKHPNIVTIYDVGTESGIDYIVMDFIKGCPLSHSLPCSFPIRKSLQIIKQAALALELAHQHGIIHRDLKPSNLMLEEYSNKVVIMDFGLAKNIYTHEEITQSGGILGTPHYMAPEQAQSLRKEISARTDVYALGAILYEMLAGVKAIEGEQIINVIFNVVHKDPIPLCKRNKKISKDLEIICHKAMEKPPALRYQSAKALANDIERFLNGENILANPGSLWYRSFKKIVKHKWVIATFFAFVLVFTAFYWHNQLQQKQKAALYLKEVNKRLNVNFIRETQKQLQLKKLSEHNIVKALEIYIQCGDILEKARILLPKSHLLRQKLYLIQKNIGSLALEKENFLLAEIAFKHCLALDKSSQSQELLVSLEQRRTKKQKQQLEKLDKIMAKLEEKLPQRALMDWYVMQILRMPGKHTLTKLISLLQNGNFSQRLLSIEALGKFTDAHTKIQGKDIVEWLLQRLQRISFDEKKEMETLVWALGWLRDSRANKLVSIIRTKMGQNSPFWKRTTIPYTWIPVPKKTTADVHTISIMKSMKGDTKGAIEDFTRLIAKNPKQIQLYMHRAMAL